MAEGSEGPPASTVTGEGPPLLLVAGTGYPGATWSRSFVGALSRRCRVIAFDHRGTGATPGTSEAYSTRLFAADAVGLLDALGLASAHVLGHSMGGRVAQWMALDAPGRVRSLVLAATGPGQYRPDAPITRGLPLGTAQHMIELGYERYMSDHIRQTFFSPRAASEMPEVVEELVASFWDNRPSLGDYLRHIVARQEHQTAELLDRLNTPALVLVGAEDTGVRGTGSHLDQSRFLAGALAHAELVVLEGAAHGYFWELPGRSADLVASWVERVERGDGP